jgi:hypothetical protein
MQKLLGVISIVSAFMVLPETVLCQQMPMAFTNPVGVRPGAAASLNDTIGRDKWSHDEKEHPSRVPYVVVGAIVGGLAGAAWFAHEIAVGLSHGGEWMAFPTIGAARYVGGGLVLGGVAGLIVYYIAHPD